MSPCIYMSLCPYKLSLFPLSSFYCSFVNVFLSMMPCYFLLSLSIQAITLSPFYCSFTNLCIYVCPLCPPLLSLCPYKLSLFHLSTGGLSCYVPPPLPVLILSLLASPLFICCPSVQPSSPFSSIIPSSKFSPGPSIQEGVCERCLGCVCEMGLRFLMCIRCE